jgi:hypothetical protein
MVYFWINFNKALGTNEIKVVKIAKIENKFSCLIKMVQKMKFMAKVESHFNKTRIFGIDKEKTYLTANY